MPLSSSQEAFAQAVAQGKSQSDAYRSAYPKSAKWTPETLWSAASRMMAADKVSARVKELQRELSELSLWTREKSVKVLADIADNGEKDGDRVRAVAELNSMHGFNEPVKVAHSGTVTQITRRIID